ncbi:MAG: SCO family protein [Anaerolineales bacterium]|nr:SCO family protein [Anaerolineales bacterium]
MERRFIWVVIGMLAVLAVVTAILLQNQGQNYRGVRYEPPAPAFDFGLAAPDGRTVRLGDFRGQAVLLFFGYTSCPDVCPTTLAELRQVRADLGGDAERVQVVFVTVDPERDTPERIQNYVSAFDPSFVGLSGDLAELEAVWEAYGVFREIDDTTFTAAGYLVTHSARTYLIDPDGNLFLSYGYGTPPDDVLHDIRLLLRVP